MTLPKGYEDLSDEEKKKVEALMPKPWSWKGLVKEILWMFVPAALLLIGVALMFLGPIVGWNSVTWMGLILAGIALIWGILLFIKWHL